MRRSMLLERLLSDQEADLGRGLSGRLFVAFPDVPKPRPARPLYPRNRT